MHKPKDPRELATAILTRSKCRVQVGAVLTDAHGIHSWGWNSSGPTGLGLCAERHALFRANHERLGGSILYVAARRARSRRIVHSRPCEACARAIVGRVPMVTYRNGEGAWVKVATKFLALLYRPD